MEWAWARPGVCKIIEFKISIFFTKSEQINKSCLFSVYISIYKHLLKYFLLGLKLIAYLFQNFQGKMFSLLYHSNVIMMAQ